MDNYTLNDFKAALQSNSKNLFGFIYKIFYPRIKDFIVRNSGTEQDAKDVFQEAIMAVINNVETHKLEGTTLFWNYFFSICKYIWFGHLRKPKMISLQEDDLDEEYILNEEELELVEDSIEKGIYHHNFKKLDNSCQKLLRLVFKGEPLSKITKKLGFKTSNYTKKRKFLCKDRLIKLIKEDPDYKIFMRDKEI